jgi:cysteine desulfurase family protein (TIGR01976 family)
MTPLDPERIRPRFPALTQEVSGRPVVFLDGPGGTQVPQEVIDAMTAYLRHDNANTDGAFATSHRTDHTIRCAREAAADLLGCDADEVVFGPNMTTLTFSLARSLGREMTSGDEVVVTRLDHDANVAPWRALEERGVRVHEVDIHEKDCTLDMDDLERKIGPRTRLVAVTHASNAVGTIPDVRAVIRAARGHGSLVFVDAVHYAPHGPLDVRGLDCDFLACSPYKFFGPHLGLLYGKREHLERLRPYKVRPSHDEAPGRWETGTQSHEALAGLVAAVDYLADLGRGGTGRRADLLTAMDRIRRHERRLVERLITGLLRIPGLRFYGIREPKRFDQRTPTVSIRLDGLPPREISRRLGEAGIFTWDGNYYALSLTERLGVEASGGMVRLGLVHYNTAAEVDRTLEALGSLSL